MTDGRLAQQLRFVLELDKLKQVLRRTLLTDGSRLENSAEHSWHLAMMAMVLAEHADEPVRLERVLGMLLVHDVVEIDAGDTFAYDEQGLLTQAAREAAAAERLFGLLPPDQGAELRALWEEFDARESADARFAAALDRLQPLLHNLQTGGGTWRVEGVTIAHVLRRIAPIAAASGTLWDHAEALIAAAQREGLIAPAAPDGTGPEQAG